MINSVIKQITLIILLGFGSLCYAQDQGQTIRGEVVDKVTLQPIFNALINLEGTDLFVTTDSLGVFRITEVPVGRYMIKATHTSYSTLIEPLLLGAGKEQVLRIELEQRILLLDSVVVRNRSWMISSTEGNGISLSMDEINRIPANYFDPVRMLTSFPGTAAANDQANHLIVRGRSPNTILWRLEGLNMVNPNHQTNAGTLSDVPVQTGGGVNILSGQMLGKTQFTADPVDPDLGNGWSVINMEFRDGNAEKWETTLQASLIGIDIAEEGPIGGGSFIANYRYSFVGILTGLGLDFGGESISFQDLSFSYSLPREKSRIKIFGMGGLSSNTFEAVEDESEWEVDKDSQDIQYQGKTGALGFSYRTNTGRNSSLELSTLYSATNQARDYTENDIPLAIYNGYGREEFTFQRELISNRIEFKRQWKKGWWRLGSLNDFHYAQIRSRYYAESSGTFIGENRVSLLGINWQPYLQVRWMVSPRLTVIPGLRYSYFTHSKSSSFEPRLDVSYDFNSRNYITILLARNSMTQPARYYLTNSRNRYLGFSYSDNLTVVYGYQARQNFQLKLTAYLQCQDEIPEFAPLFVSAANQFEELPLFNLANEGKARNYGLEAVVERKIENGFYLLGGSSIYKSEFRAQSAWWDSRFDGNFTLNITMGKERMQPRQNKKRYFRYSGRILLIGGFNQRAIDSSLSSQSRTTVYDYGQPFVIGLENYIRLDLSVSWRTEKPGSSRVFGIDIQNVLNREHSFGNYFDVRQDRVISKNQLGLIPVMYYRIEF